ncbi:MULTISPECIES: hypothetical protein [unclassified Oceanispirochaeta]|uniref:hypothetical protein n=1 Tax=unclassified Oceanispirochaeta TaxID=2635722 RepID=UPI000E09C935|nr:MULTISPECIES: hypothetical protein [unclassified Oceanispirochaeta]MBF9015536.1 hypothetical protein [Oceanispirochaeta sp. M2]NPD73975.1 hypothetical protein [Oceanispirochaeta sp. M1]RDG30285.1 hypothetical protein DV872_17915 [Oceanispirochaeta sp. M1]
MENEAMGKVMAILKVATAAGIDEISRVVDQPGGKEVVFTGISSVSSVLKSILNFTKDPTV